ncbi:TPA: peptide deformylase, partial [Candidatus Uhrbacteria bacterium]|nr:peptide deformylase [Candidatus Uhrbacteria bacterium]
MNILTNPDPELRKKSLLVDESRFGSEELLAFGEELIATMMDDDGVGIAAPQVGVHDRIIVVNMVDTGP